MGDTSEANRMRAAGVVVITLVALAVTWLVGIRGDFPLSDDWAYAHVVRELWAGRGLHFLPWTGASVIAQATWGALACRLFGFDFEVLRATTLVLSWSGAVATWLLARRGGLAPQAAAMATACVALNPVWVNLSFTFMTDVPFAALLVWSALAFLAATANDGGLRRLAVAVALCSAAALVRQHAIFLAAAAAVTMLTSPPRPGRPTVARLASATVVAATPAIVLTLWYALLWAGDALPQAATNKAAEIVAVGPLRIADAGFRAIATLGLFTLPLTLADARLGQRLRRPETLAAAALLLVGATTAWLRDGSTMPYLPNVLQDGSLGATSLRDSLALGLGPPGRLGAGFSLPLTGAALFGATLLAGHLRERWQRRDPFDLLCSLAFALLMAGSLLQARYYFDRYLLAVLPFACLCLGRDLGRELRPAGPIAAALMAAFAVAGTHDYLQWNRARWQLLEGLEARPVDARRIDGGMEYNAWRLADELGTWPTDDDVRQGAHPDRRSWWWVVDDEWVVAFRALEGYEVVASAPWSRWLGGDTPSVLLLRRLAGEREHLGVHAEERPELEDDLHGDAHP